MVVGTKFCGGFTVNPKPGDMFMVAKGRHFYPDGWIVGTDPPRFKVKTMVIYLETQEKSQYETREFWKIFTDKGVGIINSIFCEKLT